jgi:hypothetical protein
VALVQVKVKEDAILVELLVGDESVGGAGAAIIVVNLQAPDQELVPPALAAFTSQ